MFFRWHGKTLLFLWCSISNCPTTSTYHSMTFRKLEKRSRSYNFMRFFLTIQFVWAKNSVQWLGLPGPLPSGSHHPDLYFFLVWELCKPSFATGILGGEATQATAKVSTDCLFFGGVLSSRMLVSWWSGPSWIWNYINSGRGRFAYNTALAIQENMHAQKPNNGCPNNMYI